MSGSLPPLRVDIVAKDTTGPVLDRANKRLAQTGQAAEKAGKATAKLGETSGITRLSEGMHTLSLSSGDVFRSLSQISPAMQGITGAVTLAGMTTLVQRWGQFGQQLHNTSLTIGVPVNKITALSGAAKQLGIGADSLTSGLDTLQEKLRGAAFQRDPEAIRTFNQLGVAFKDSSGNAREAGDVFGDVADSIKKKYDTLGRGAALRATDALGMHDLFPLLIKGRAGIQALEKDTKNLGGVVTPGMAQRAQDLAQSFERVDIAVGGVENRMGDQWSGPATRFMNSLATMAGENKELTLSFANLSASILALGATIPVGFLARKLGMTGVASALAMLRTVAPVGLALELSGDTDPNATAAGAPSWAKPGGFLGRGGGLERWWGGVAPTWLGGNPSPSPTHTADTAMSPTRRAFLDSLAMGESKGYNEGNPRDSRGRILSTAHGRYQFLNGTDAQVSAETGLPGQDPISQDRKGWYYAAKVYRQNTGRDLEADSKDPARWEGIASALNTVWPSLPGGSQQNTTMQQWKRHMADNMAAYGPQAQATRSAGWTGAPQPVDGVRGANGAVDVNVHLHGAPPGTRATATGSGNVNVSPPRVETAMPAH